MEGIDQGKPMRRMMTAAMALALAIPFAGCSSLNIFSDPSRAATAGGDDAKCQEDGWVYGSPEYLQCRQNLEIERTTAERAAEHFPYPMQR
jgi:hypothetical protein